MKQPPQAVRGEYRMVQAHSAPDVDMAMPSRRLEQIGLGTGAIGIVAHRTLSARPSRLEQLCPNVSRRDLQRIGAGHAIASTASAPRTVGKLLRLGVQIGGDGFRRIGSAGVDHGNVQSDSVKPYVPHLFEIWQAG